MTKFPVFDFITDINHKDNNYGHRLNKSGINNYTGWDCTKDVGAFINDRLETPAGIPVYTHRQSIHKVKMHKKNSSVSFFQVVHFGSRNRLSAAEKRLWVA